MSKSTLRDKVLQIVTRKGKRPGAIEFQEAEVDAILQAVLEALPEKSGNHYTKSGDVIMVPLPQMEDYDHGYDAAIDDIKAIFESELSKGDE